MLAAQHLYERDVTVSIANSYDNAALQARQIDSLAGAGIDLLVVAPNEDNADINAAIARVRQRGIPVVFFDRKTSFADYTAFIGGNNVDAGRAVGNYALQMVRQQAAGHKPLVIEITGFMGSTPARERHQGFAEAMQSHDDIDYTCLEGDWTSDKACLLATRQIKSGRLPDLVFCHNDGMATGVYKAAVETKNEGRIRILGIDGMPGEGLEYVKLGHQVGTYVYPTHGEQIVRLAIDILSRKPFDRHNTLRGQMVTPENVTLTQLNAEELMAQNNNLVTIQNKLEEYLGLYAAQQRLSWALAAAILALVVGCVVLAVGYYQTRRAIRQRQALNEEQTLMYTHATPHPMRSLLETPQQAPPTPRSLFETPQEELPTPRSQDVLFAEQLNAVIREKMSNSALKMDELGEAVGLSRVQLYRRVKAITGMTPVELLRQMRLQQGYMLLATTTKTVQEIAYEVGFGTPGYFSKCFKQQYGKYPMELRS